MKQLLIAIVLFANLGTVGYSQNNLLSATGSLKNLYPPGVMETKGAVFVTRAYAGQRGTTLYVNPCSFYVEKYSPDCTSLAQVAYITGDTVQIDSFVSYFQFSPVVSGSKLIFVYPKTILRDSSLPVYQRYLTTICMKVLDTNLNTLIPEKRLITDSGNHRYRAINLQTAKVINNSLTILYILSDTANLQLQSTQAKFLKVDFAGNVLTQDTVPVKRVSAPPAFVIAEEVHELDNHNILWAGKNIAIPFFGTPYQFVITDSNYNVIDTFFEKPFPYTKPGEIYGGYFSGDFNIVPLPGGSLIGGRQFEYATPGMPAARTYTALTKLYAHSRYSFDSLKVFGAKDGNDDSHSTFISIHCLAYNAKDHRVYFSNSTHAEFATGCTGSYNYIQIISTDTNISNPWRKYIYSGPGYCMQIGHVLASVSRPGVIVTGGRSSIANPQDSSLQTGFIYQVDSSTNLGIGDPHAPITIRNRIATYPNPAKNILTIDDILARLATATLTNMQGQLIYQSSISGSKATIRLDDYADGLYLLRVQTTDGERYTEKLLIQH